MRGWADSAIVGIGTSVIGRAPGDPTELAVAAIEAACDDAGITTAQLDGLLINRSPIKTPKAVGLTLQDALGVDELALLSVIDAEGSSACQMVQYATLAIGRGLASTVACVFSDAPLGDGAVADSYAFPLPITGVDGLEANVGLLGAASAYALAADRYLTDHDLGEDHLAAVAITARRWAARNPLAQRPEALDLEAHRRSRYVAAPLRVADCAVPVNGAVAVVLVAAEHADSQSSAPSYVLGMAQGHVIQARSGDAPLGVRSGAAVAAARLYADAGIGPADIDACQIYDPFASVTLTTLEDYGFYGPGQAAHAAIAGDLAPGGRLPTNTGGGQIAGFYLQGMTPLHEGALQASGRAGDRQLDRHDVVLVAGHGGLLERHAAVLLGPQRELG